jgi:hypothetical protein
MELIRLTGAPVSAVLTVLLVLELARRCRRQPGIWCPGPEAPDFAGLSVILNSNLRLIFLQVWPYLQSRVILPQSESR